jgi:hypothetical protein
MPAPRTRPVRNIRLALIELERREVVSETLSFLAGGMLGELLGLSQGDASATPPAAARTGSADAGAPAAASPPPTLDLLARNWQPATPLDEPPATRSAAAPPDAGVTAATLHDPWADPLGNFVGFGASDDPVAPARHSPAAPGPQPPPTGAAVPSPVAFRAESAAAPGPQGASAGPMAAAAPIMVAPAGRAAARAAAAAPQATGSGGSLMMMDDTGGGGGAVKSETSLLIAPGDQEIEVTATVSVAEDHFRWQYDVRNLSYTGLDEGDPSTGDVAHFFVRSSVPGTANADNTLGWFDAIDAPTPYHDGTWNVVWGANDKSNLLPPGDSGSFSFTTPVCGIGHVNAEAGEADDNFEALGQVLGPVNSPNSVSATLDSYIPVNANNDNYDPGDEPEGENHPQWASVDGVEQPGIPYMRDFNWNTALTHPDSELRPVTISWSGTNGGTVAVKDLENGTGRLKFWSDAKKTSRVDTITVQGNSGSRAIYVEGVHESATVGDVSMQLTYTDGNGITVVWSQPVSVTPVVENMQVTPATQGTWQVPGQNVDFVNYKLAPNSPLPPADAIWIPTWFQGLKAAGDRVANDPSPYPGATFSARAFDVGVNMQFLQNVTGAVNGKNADVAGWVFMSDSGYAVENEVLPDHPLLDNLPNSGPFYALSGAARISELEELLLGKDTPSTGIPRVDIYKPDGSIDAGASIAATEAMLEKTLRIDVEDHFKLYYVVSYGDGSIYSVSSVTWRVNWFAEFDGTSPIIRDPFGVKADPYRPDNSDPWTAGPVANDVIRSDPYGWQ